MRNELIRDIAGLLGLVLVAAGSGMIYHPAGVILGGVELVALALYGFKPEKTTGN